ncbi:HYD1 signature containing ADP-ribosyltransferase family protein [Flavobacterium sp. N1736]|uniref:HYD1 signature containing ADP-ribosyltransferase family protein n=1 Tax=Flavobacterium sp. N1736 TaxID=2986823 RepID=UPI0022250FE0|nr:HYD1 signature containing ADP-ribosyltransferase family protein [Flavobacterium sp. N1736]
MHLIILVYFIDPDGMMANEYDIDLVTGATTQVSNKGGNTTDYLNFKKENGETLYTHEVAVQHNQAIMESGELISSVGAKNARHGSGQYFTDLVAGDLTSGQVSRRLFGVPWNSKKLTNFIDVDLGGLKVIENTPNNFLVPNTGTLSLQGRIVNHGVSVFKQ